MSGLDSPPTHRPTQSLCELCVKNLTNLVFFSINRIMESIHYTYHISQIYADFGIGYKLPERIAEHSFHQSYMLFQSMCERKGLANTNSTMWLDKVYILWMNDTTRHRNTPRTWHMLNRLQLHACLPGIC